MDHTHLEKLKAEILSEFPSFKIVPKPESTLMRVVNVLLRIITFGQMKLFMRFATVVGYTVYVPDTWEKISERGKAILLRHERVHMRQRKKYTLPLFIFLYLFLFFPVGLAYFRMKFEKEAYEESMRAVVEYYGVHVLEVSSIKNSYVEHFTTAQYFWMWPFRGAVERWYDEKLEELRKS